MMSCSPDSSLVEPDHPAPVRPRRTWRPAEVVALVVAACYGAAALVLAAAIFIRLVQ